MIFGPVLVGVELDGRWGEEKTARDISSSGPNPFFFGSVLHSYAYKNDAGIHLSGRLGVIVADTLFFAKAGFGVAHVKDTFSADQTGALACIAGPCLNAFGGPVLAQFGRGGTGSFVFSRWLAAAILGVGMEQNFGAAFVRIGAEAEWVSGYTVTFTQPTAPGWTFAGSTSSGSSGRLGDQPSSQWAGRANLLVGVRF